ncbi:hypothetical protein Ae717Ps2_6799c [Pseudonocardia sp. Ae717_Ps2]|nr:hypothetical protein Ae717Ps2_6799c [Pseudonocardia sp. Ae717_Ps2]
MVGRAQHAGVTTAITSHGKRVAAIVPAEVLDLLDELEDRALSAWLARPRPRPAGPSDHATLLAEFDQH